MKTFVFLLFFIPLFCHSQKTITYWDNGQKESEGYYIEGKKEGIWKEWDRWGKLLSKGKYKDGLKDGKWIDQTSWNVIYDSIQFPEYYNEYFGNNQFGEGNYKGGLKNGKWKTWSYDGISSYRNYKNDTLDGNYLEYYIYGGPHVPIIKGTFLAGKKTGEWYFFDPGGILPNSLNDITARDYEFHDDFAYGYVFTKGYFKNDKRDSVWNFWGIDTYINEFLKTGRSIDITDDIEINAFIDMVESLKFKIIGDSLNYNIYDSEGVSTGYVICNDGKFNGKFILEHCERTGNIYELSLIHISEPTRPY